MHAIDHVQRDVWSDGQRPLPQRHGALKVALYDHDRTRAEEIQRALLLDGLEVERFSDTIDLLEALSERNYEAVIASIDPEAGARGVPDGLQVLLMCRSSGVMTPFVIVNHELDLRVFGTVTKLPAAVSIRPPFASIDVVRLVGELGRYRPRASLPLPMSEFGRSSRGLRS